MFSPGPTGRDKQTHRRISWVIDWIGLEVDSFKVLQKTLKFSACAGSSTYTKIIYNNKMYAKKNVMCQLSDLNCHMSYVTSHLSPVTNANSHSHTPSPCLLPTMHRRLVMKDRTSLFTQSPNWFQNIMIVQTSKKKFLSFDILTKSLLTRSPYSNRSWPMPQTHWHSDILAFRLNLPRGGFIEITVLVLW